ncbi:hypothetical protein HHI36_018512, partial [Cryptolaemus montrouzieri]
MYKINGCHNESSGCPTVSSKEQLIAQILGIVSDRGFYLTKVAIRGVIEKYVTKQERVARVVPQWKIVHEVLILFLV